MSIRMKSACLILTALTVMEGNAESVPGVAASAMSTASGSALVTHAPFSLSFSALDGSVVLQTQQAGNQDPHLASAGEVLGADKGADRIICGPITYEIGGSANPQYPAGPWVGNIVAGASGGIQYQATEVIRSSQAGNGLELTLATNEPSGREVSLTLRPDIENTLRVQIQVVPDHGVSAVAACFQKSAGESFHGFGGRHNAINQDGNDFLNFIVSQNIGGGAYIAEAAKYGLDEESAETYMFPSGESAAYHIHNSFTSTAGYGFFLDRFELTGFRFGLFGESAWQVWSSSPQLDFMVIPSDEVESVKTLSAINGRHRAPKDIEHLGPVLSRAIRVIGPEADDAKTYAAKVEADLERILDPSLEFPVTGYVFEAWEIMPWTYEEAAADGSNSISVQEVIEKLHAAGIKAYLYTRNYVGIDPANTERPEFFVEAFQNGYAARTAGGTPYLIGSNFLGAGMVVDFTNPAARVWWKNRIRLMIELGADGFMQDFGENVQLDMHFYDGSTGVTMHNKYPNLFHQTTREAIDEYELAEGADAREIFFFTRAAFSGRDGKGSAAYENSNFPGDETTEWHRASGLASLANNMLSSGVGGAYGFNTNIGGYWDYPGHQETGPELFTRWAQWAALSPVFRVHNNSTSGVKMPWHWDELDGGATRNRYTAAAKLHFDAAPLVQKLWIAAEETGMPPVRPLWLHYPEDERARMEDQQWLLGPDILVAPVVEEGAETRKVYFPEGIWKDQNSGNLHFGPGEAVVDAPIDVLPWFVQCRKPANGQAIICPKDPFKVSSSDEGES